MNAASDTGSSALSTSMAKAGCCRSETNESNFPIVVQNFVLGRVRFETLSANELWDIEHMQFTLSDSAIEANREIATKFGDNGFRIAWSAMIEIGKFLDPSVPILDPQSGVEAERAPLSSDESYPSTQNSRIHDSRIPTAEQLVCPHRLMIDYEPAHRL